MGARGKLRLPPHLQAVPDDAAPTTAASSVQPNEPSKPESVSDHPELSQVWDEMVEALTADGFLARSDGTTLELYCRHFVLARQAWLEVATSSVSTHDHHNGSDKKHPAEAVFRAESAMCLKYGQLLGLSFVTRARTPVKEPTGDGQEPNPFATPAAQ